MRFSIILDKFQMKKSLFLIGGMKFLPFQDSSDGINLVQAKYPPLLTEKFPGIHLIMKFNLSMKGAELNNDDPLFLK